MIDIDRLISLALDELPATDVPEVEEHLLACGRCARVLEQLVQLGSGVRELVGAGKVRFAVGADMLQRLVDSGLVAKVYRVPAGGSVNCSVGTKDVYISAELSADLRGVQRVDVIKHVLGHSVRVDDVPFDREHGIVRTVELAEFLRMLPTTQVVIELVDGDRSIAKYHFNHSAA
jgi:hypothetical protein